MFMFYAIDDFVLCMILYNRLYSQYTYNTIQFKEELLYPTVTVPFSQLFLKIPQVYQEIAICAMFIGAL